MQFHIDDMTCGGCASTVKKTILTLDANATVRTDPATRLVDVETSLSAEQATLRFSLREIIPIKSVTNHVSVSFVNNM